MTRVKGLVPQADGALKEIEFELTPEMYELLVGDDIKSVSIPAED